MAQEAGGLDAIGEVLGVARPFTRIDAPYSTPDAGAECAERREIMLAEEDPRGLVHPLEVERIANQP